MLFEITLVLGEGLPLLFIILQIQTLLCYHGFVPGLRSLGTCMLQAILKTKGRTICPTFTGGGEGSQYTWPNLEMVAVDPGRGPGTYLHVQSGGVHRSQVRSWGHRSAEAGGATEILGSSRGSGSQLVLRGHTP